MYDENSLKSYIFWMKVKRIFYIILLSIIGCAIGVVISSYLIDVLNFEQNLRIVIISASTLLLFLISLLITSNIAKDIQDGYWKIAMLKKANSISKKLDRLEEIEKILNINQTTKQTSNNTTNEEIESQTNIENKNEENTEEDN